MWKEVRDREAGKLPPITFASRVRSCRVSALGLSNHKEIVSPHHGAVNALQVDLTEGRYLLSGASDGSAAVYDIQRATDYEEGLIARHRSLFVVDKQHEYGHKFAISTAIWYPVDTGLFVTGSFDHFVKVWDTNTTQVVMDFKMPGKVYGTAMSSIAKAHMLIAAGSADVQVRLCDIASGAFTHTLSGHRVGGPQYRSAGRPIVARTSLAGSSSLANKSVSRKKSPLGNGMKQSQALHKPQNLLRTPVRQRSHPGMSSSHDRATAHYGAVTGLKASVDGMYLLSSGYCYNQLLLFQSAGSGKSYFECGNLEQSTLELYTGSNDRQILVWSPPSAIINDLEEDNRKEQKFSADKDNWSD
ncbi:hypothetical protein BHE74_00006492 [Ensete ventricosum]|nr:hypothetical protein BHE74_00006492 [Ensete ventricosum]